MNNQRHNTHYRRGEFGLNQNLAVLLSLCCFVLAVGLGSLSNGAVNKKFENLKNTNSLISGEKIQYLRRLRSSPTPEVDLLGNYRYLVDYGSGHLLKGHIYIDNQRVSRRIEINHQSMSGSAEYDIVGSTIQYKHIDGDKYLFNVNGTAIGSDTQYGTYLEFDGDMKLFIQTGYAAQDYKPLDNKFDVPLIARLKHMTLWQILQWIFLFNGVAVLLYVLYRIIRSNSDQNKPNKPAGRSLAA